MYSLHQKHPQHSEIIHFDNQKTILEIEKLIAKEVGIDTINIDNISDYRKVLNNTTAIYHILGSDYTVTNLDYATKRAEYESHNC